jgi:hypothetical protein
VTGHQVYVPLPDVPDVELHPITMDGADPDALDLSYDVGGGTVIHLVAPHDVLVAWGLAYRAALAGREPGA